MDHHAFFKILKMTQDQSQPHLQLESTWCLANMASGTSEQTNLLIQRNVIELFNQLAQSPFAQLSEQAIWGLGNIAGDCVEFRNIIFKGPSIGILIDKFNKSTDKRISGLIAWVFANVCRLRPSTEKINAVFRSLLAILKRVYLETNDADLKSDCLYGFYSNAKADSLDIFNDPQFLVALLKHYVTLQASYTSGSNILSPIHTFLGGFTSGDNMYSQMVIEVGFLPCLKNSLCIPDSAIGREVCWIFSNMAIGETEQTRRVILEEGLIEILCKLSQHTDVNLAREAIWTICNFFLTKDDLNLKLLLDKNILQLFKFKLDADSDQKILTLILEALINMLEYFRDKSQDAGLNPFVRMLIQQGIGESIEKLQYNQSDLIYLKAHMILETHFPLEH
jgi:hypothetical protein